MAEYKGIKGFKVQYLDQDPVPTVAGWSAGGNMATARAALAGCGTQTAGLVFGGGFGTGPTNITEEYNGATWTAGGNLNTSRDELAASKIGTQSSALAFGGNTGTYPVQTPSVETELYDGSTWTSNPTGLITARRALGGTGTQTASLAFGGYTTVDVSSTESWDGISWTTSPGSLNTARRYIGSAGTQTAALAFGGSTNSTESWNGTSWANENLSPGNQKAGSGATYNAAIAVGGSPNTSAVIFDGINWTSISSLATGRTDGTVFGIQNLAAYAGGYPPTNATEEYTVYGEPNTFENIGQVWYNGTTKALKYTNLGAGTWASGGNLNTQRFDAGAAGTQTAALAFGGYTSGPPLGSPTAATESYDGSTWTTLPATLSSARSVAGSGGTQTAAIAAGSTSSSTVTDEYNGSTWTAGGSLNTARYYSTGAGTQTAAYVAGGAPGGTSNTSETEEYDGATWTTGGNLVNAVSFAGAIGTSADALHIGGGVSSPAQFFDYTQSYDGSAWSLLNAMNTARRSLGASSTGPTTSAIAFGGQTPSATSATEIWDGTSWTNNPVGLPSAISGPRGVGTGTLALSIGGGLPVTNATSEWSRTATAIKTITVS